MRFFALLTFSVLWIQAGAQESAEPTSVRSRSGSDSRVVDQLFGVDVKPSPLTPPMADKIEKQIDHKAGDKHRMGLAPVDPVQPVERPISRNTNPSFMGESGQKKASEPYIDDTPEPDYIKDPVPSSLSAENTSSSSTASGASRSAAPSASVSTQSSGNKPFAGLFGNKSSKPKNKPGLLKKIFAKKSHSPERVTVTK